MKSIEYRKAFNNALIRKFDYTYNSQNFIASQKVYDSSSNLIELKEYEYDTLGRLTKAKTKDPITEQVTDTLEFQMDDIGNLTHEFDDETTESTYLYATNNMNELIKVKEDETPRSNPDVDVWGTVSVDSGATITLLKVNNLNASYSGGYFSKDDLSLNSNATQNVSAVVTDSRGYTTTHTVTLYYDEMADIGYAYDLRGNMIYKSEHGEETLYIYDDRDLLREAHLPTGDRVIIETGPCGRRLKRKFYDASEDSWETTYYVYAGIQNIADYDANWNLEEYYIPGLGIDRIEIMHKNDTDYYFVCDHLRSVRLVLDSNCDIVEQYEYSTYGELTIKNGSGQTISSSAIGNRHTYTGREWDENLDLYYYRARWYNPKMRRFTQKDMVHFTNRYIYVLNNPMNFIDPFGLSILDIIEGVVSPIWSAPNTAFGFCVGLSCLDLPEWKDGTIVFNNPKGPIAYGMNKLNILLNKEDLGGITFGRSIILWDCNGEKHERRHSWQFDILGPFYLPIYLLLSVNGYANNPFEIDAYNNQDNYQYLPFLFWGYPDNIEIKPEEWNKYE